MKSLLAFALSVTAAFAQYKMEPISAAPEGLAPAFASLLQPQGYRILQAGGSPVCEIWFRSTAPGSSQAAADAVAFPGIPHGAFIGVIRFPAAGADRRGQTIKPGLYTLRYSQYPVDGAHQGVAPQRDFLLLTPAAEDKDPNAQPAFPQLMAMSRKASGTPHPACLSMEPPSSEATFPSFAQEGEHDWALNVKIGDLAVGVILIGKAEG